MILDDYAQMFPTSTVPPAEVFGQVLKTCGHQAAAHYASLTLREQVAFRDRFRKRCNPKRPDSARRRAIWAQYEAELKLARITQKLESM